MPKVDIWSRLTTQSQGAVQKSREQHAALEPQATDALGLAREGYNHERAYWNSFPVALPSVQDLSIGTPAGQVALRLYKPQTGGPLPVLVYVHGGGYILGNLDTHDRICRLLAARSGWVVLAVDYALAPEKQFPSQPDQVFAVLQYVAANGAALGVDSARIAIGGDSAGAQLSLAATLDARSAGGPAVCAQLLFYGAFGLKDSASRRLYGWADLDGLGDTDANTYRDYYIADPADRDHARVNLLKSDMAGLPPTFIGAVAYDPLRDDSLVLAEFMKECGVTCRLVVYEGVLHGFMHYSALEPKAMQAIDDGAAFLRDLPL
jgi:acetyl esterase